MGIDFGTKRIGLAIGDTVTGIASPWRVIEQEEPEQAIERIIELMHEEHVEALVVGVPLTPDGRAVSDTGEAAENFAEQLEKHDLLVYRENEILSSKVAKVLAMEQGEKHKRDDLAATAILQTYLDREARIGDRGK